MKPTLQAHDFTINTTPKKSPAKKGKRSIHPDDEKKVNARRRIEDIEAQREWDKEWDR